MELCASDAGTSIDAASAKLSKTLLDQLFREMAAVEHAQRAQPHKGDAFDFHETSLLKSAGSIIACRAGIFEKDREFCNVSGFSASNG